MHSDESRTSGGADVKAVIRHIEQLPAPPPVAVKILTEVMEETADFVHISPLIESDPALTVKVLRMANSMKYDYRGHIENVEQALSTIGFTSLKNAMLSVIIRDTFFAEPQQGDTNLTNIWKHTLASAVATELLAEEVAPELASVAFTAGMVHDCGKLVLLMAMPHVYERLLDESKTTGAPMLDLETEAIGVDHTQAGKWLLQQWQLPARLTDAAWLHHQTPDALAGLGVDRRLITLVQLGNLLAHDVMVDGWSRPQDTTRDALVAHFGLTDDAVEAIKSRIGHGYAKRAAIFDLDADAARFYFEALQRANASLAGMNANLFDTSERLRRAGRILETIGVVGPSLAAMHDPWDAFILMASTMRTRLGSREGFVYRVNADLPAMEGLYWNGTTTQELRLPLTEELALPQDAAETIPSGALAAVLTGYLSRSPVPDGEAPTRLIVQSPFCIAPLATGSAFIGEMLFVPEQPSARLLTQEHIGYCQLAGLLAATLERLDLLARLESRAEHLATTLRKLKGLNSKLVQAERLAAVGQLAAGAAHEINNPLAIIYARTQLMEHREQDEKKKRDLSQMKEQIERITSILSNLMDFARPMPPKMQKTNLADVVTRTLALVRGEMGKQGIRLETDLAPDLPHILGDANQLEQVLLNLVINAEHAITEREDPATPGRIHVRTRLTGSGRRAVLTVTDNGVGMTNETLKKIFDPFYSTKEEGKGTGLGLSTSYSIVAGHDGEMTYESAPGRGTTARVTLPLATPDAQASTPTPAPAPPVDDAILVVDDERHIRDILSESLEAKGYRVETACNGEEGLARLASHSYRLLLLDLRMPSRDGLSLLTHVQDKLADMPVVILTGMAGPDEVDQAMRLGARRCIRKPFEINALLTEVETLLGKEES
ncbi:HDOD domain-containing protein [Desulfobaculum sp. SPO524]|uniref:HDOD domain-containing protein n=1 Tax=Desulfobaculum sp. SPO524 TaxID=3378071 RepID=UPI00385242A7